MEIFEISSQGHVTWPYLVSSFSKFDINAHNFRHSGSNSIKIKFLNSSHQALSNDVYFVWFRRGPHFPIVIHCFWLLHHYDVISSHMTFKSAYFVEPYMDYQSAKFQCCRLCLAGSIDKLRKHNDDVIMTSFHVAEI